MRILLVDDDSLSLSVLQDALESEGFAVESCTSGRDALARLLTNPFDVLLTDFVMPHMSGPELISRARDTHPSLRCMIMSGHANGAHPTAQWIPKPIDLDDLLAKLR